MSDIWTNIRAYDAMLSDLEQHYSGKFVVIHEGELIDAFDNLDNAATEALKRFGTKDSYLIRQVGQLTEFAMPASVAFRRIDVASAS